MRLNSFALRPREKAAEESFCLTAQRLLHARSMGGSLPPGDGSYQVLQQLGSLRTAGRECSGSATGGCF